MSIEKSVSKLHSQARLYKLGYLTVNLIILYFTLSSRSFIINNWFIFVALYVVTTTSYFLVQGSDPGYLDKYNITSIEWTENLDIKMTDKEQGTGIACDHNDQIHLNTQSDKAVCIESNLSSLTMWCRRCERLMPIRSHHCRACDQCVANFDHHCPVIGTCIGERNHCRFWWFIALHFICILYFMDVISTPHTHKTGYKMESSVKVLTGRLYFCFAVLLVYLGMILGMHTWFAISSMNTHECNRHERIEYLRGVEDLDLPFTKGLLGNISSFCCLRDDYSVLGYRLGYPWSSSTKPGSGTGPDSDAARQWSPTMWRRPVHVPRESQGVWDNLWRNKYYSCC